MKSLLINSFIFIIFIFRAYAGGQITDTTRMYGATIDAISALNSTVTSLSNLNYKPTTRIVFDEWQPASGYVNAVNRIHPVSFIMGEILDSYYMNQYSYDQYTARVVEYLNAFGNNVDIWEIGNEVNGEWCGSIPDVVQKIYAGFKIARGMNKTTELTLYYNKNCWSNPENEMFRWVNNSLPFKLRILLNYVLVSYYEDDCNNLQPNWQQVFDSLHVLFPNSKIGIGECGTKNSAKKETYINRYYRMNITTPNYVGGYFWWYYRQDCVPYTKPLWTVINNAMSGNTLIAGAEKTSADLENYPNPFNPATTIKFNIPASAFTTLTIYDLTVRVVDKLINSDLTAGPHEVKWDGTKYASGVYIYRLEIGNTVQVKKMLLVK